VVWAQDRAPVEGSFEHGNEPSGSLLCGDILEWSHNWQLLVTFRTHYSVSRNFSKDTRFFSLLSPVKLSP
jgi:hypothetical protein